MLKYAENTRKLDIHIKGKCRNIFCDQTNNLIPLHVDTHFGICMD